MTHQGDNHVPRLDRPLLTPAEAAQLLAVKPSWIYEAVRAGNLAACEWAGTSASPDRGSSHGRVA
jgi:excisionase family DNA binding protein